MPKIVQPDRRQPGGGHQPLEEIGHLAGVHPGAVLLGEDEPGVHPGRPPLRTVGFLLLTAPIQHSDGVVIERNGAEAAV
ncbi:hypothetical protein HRW08_32660 [Streptomyces lunaelactis]|nr:hypothetical protein [Streptomyces lunaelactis]